MMQRMAGFAATFPRKYFFAKIIMKKYLGKRRKGIKN
jgi:hypothetical protein